MTACYSAFLRVGITTNEMAEFRFEGYTYDLWIKPWKKGNRKYEALRWKTGWKCTWERIPYELFIKMKKKWKASCALANAL